LLTIIIFALANTKNMGRKGDIISKVIGVRAPIKVYTKLLNEASDKGISLSEYCVSLLSKDNLSQGGQTKIEYQDRWHIDPKLVRENEVLKNRLQEKDVLIEKLQKDVKQWDRDFRDEVLDLYKEIDRLKGKENKKP
jgi:hypothetical protein